jgi:ubiquinol-cytochrome c reductase cytochrome b subunit
MILHKKGSSIIYYTPNVTVSLKKFLIKDLAAFSIVLIIFILIIYIFPNLFIDFLNLEKADSMVTPRHIKPEWYFMPFYGILKTVPHKTGGILCMGLAIVIFLIIPFIYRFKQ